MNSHQTSSSCTGQFYAEASATEFIRLSMGLLIMDTLGKTLLITTSIFQSSFQSSDYQTWMISIGLSILGVFVYFLTMWKQGFLARHRSLYATLGIYLGLSIVFTCLFWNHQDISFDGTWYHLHRLLHQGFMSDIGGLANGISPTPGLAYPMLAGNQRAVIMKLLPGSSIYSGVGINLAIYCASIFFWCKYAIFIPRSLRWITPACCPIALAQLSTYYIDGYISSYISMGLLVSMSLSVNASTAVLRSLEDRKINTSQALPGVRIAFAVLMQASLVFALLKFSFPFLVLTIAIPLLCVTAQAFFSNKKLLINTFFFLVKSLCSWSSSMWILSALLLLANPYLNLFFNLAGLGTDPNFQIDYIKNWAKVVNEIITSQSGGLPWYLQSIDRFYFTWIPMDKTDLAQKFPSFGSVAREFARGSWGYGLLHPMVIWISSLVSTYVLISVLNKNLPGFPSLFKNTSYSSLEENKILHLYIGCYAFLLVMALSFIYPMASYIRYNPSVYLFSAYTIVCALDVARSSLFFAVVPGSISRRLRAPVAFLLMTCITILILNSLAGVALQSLRNKQFINNFRIEAKKLKQEFEIAGPESLILIRKAHHSHDAVVKLVYAGFDRRRLGIAANNACIEYRQFPSDLRKRVSPRFEYCFVKTRPSS
jgi:hypothetical protein